MKQLKKLAILLLVCLSTLAVAQAESSKLLEVKFQGPGGHSNGNYGRTSAVHAASNTVMNIVNSQTGNSFIIANFNGGNSVNSIAGSANYTLLLKAANDTALQKLQTEVEASIAQGVKQENDFRGVKMGDQTAGVPAEIRYTITEVKK